MDLLVDLCGEEVVDSSCASIGLSSVCKEAELVGFYFGDNALKACKQVESQLSEVYKEVNGESTSPRLLVIFISHDDKEEEMLAALRRMPWYALPWKSVNEGKIRKFLSIPAMNFVPDLFLVDLKYVNEYDS